MRRIMIIGGPGSGKSTLARNLGARLKLPVTHIDQIFHLPGWQERPRDEVDRQLREVHARDHWIIDGNRSSLFTERMDRADTVIFLDLPVVTRLWGLFRRWTVWRGRSRSDMAEGCPEQLPFDFVLYSTRFAWREAPRYRRLIAKAPGHMVVHHLRSRRAVDRFLKSCPQAGIRST